jgi:uncharacterized damage-inducible protein DinB
MEVRQYIIDTFRYNDYANRLALKKVAELDEKAECVKFLSHLINSMNKWLARIENSPGYEKLDWWKPEYEFAQLEVKWGECLEAWIEFLEGKTDEDINSEVEFIGFDGTMFAATIKDIALQLNYHSMHHRGQIQYLIRQQGVEPEFVDYIGTKYRRLEQ